MVAGTPTPERGEMNEYLPWDDVWRYLLMIGADVMILTFWWMVMSRFPNADETRG